MKFFASTGMALCAVLASSLALHADTAKDPDAYKDIKKAVGFVPAFVKAVPDEGVAAAWDELASIQMSTSTALPGKVKELIGLAVAAQVPCRYCAYAHTQFAKADGASDREVREAVAIAAITRHWSTVLNGMQVDETGFTRDMTRVFGYLPHAAPPKEPAPAITDAASAYKDIEQTLGSVPEFFRAFPEAGIAAAWREMKLVQMNPATALPGKAKELIGLAVAAQIPCKYCIQFHTMAAKMYGANEEELKEAVAMASLTRYWSTIVNGTMQDEAQFRRDVDQLVRNARKEAPRGPKQAARGE